MKKKIENDLDDFSHYRKLTLKVKFWHFLTPPHQPNSQNSIISLLPFENSTTRIAIAAINSATVVR